MKDKVHIPVLIQEVVELLDPQQDDVIVDATFGFGGHSRELLKKIGPKGILVAIEQDEEIFDLARGNFKDDRIIFANENFSHLKSILKKSKISKINKILFDLGISSYHFDELKKGFSFKDPELDMRLDRTQGDRASDLVNNLPENELADLLYQNADEFLSRRIARIIVEARKKKKIESAAELSELIAARVRRRGKVHPATKTFQALRIAVNDELEILKSTLPQAIDLLAQGGRIAVISFHSLEDRIVKETLKKFAREEKIEILTKKPLQATFEETKMNPRSRSAKLRVARKR